MKTLTYNSPRQGFWRKSIFAILVLLIFIQCKKDSPEEINEEEVINRVTLRVTASDNTTTNYTWNDGEAIPSIGLTTNASYAVSVHFFDASDASDIEDITEEVIEEADEHFVFYEIATADVSISSASNDVEDNDGVSINLKTQWTTADASSGIIRLYLIHEPNNKAGSTRGAIGGATDVEIGFPVTVE